MATALRISCHAPMFRALDATGRLNWVVNFQASTLISRMLLNRARRGARGKEATNRVMKPNWITETTEWGEQHREMRQLAVISEHSLTEHVTCTFTHHTARPVKSLTHLQVLIEQAQLAEVLQDVVLLPAAVMVLRVVSPLSATPPVTHQPIKEPMKRNHMSIWEQLTTNRTPDVGFAQSQQDVSRE